MERLCSQPAACLAVFRSLPNLAQVYIMRVLYLPNPLPLSTIASWCQPNHLRQHNVALTKMAGLHLYSDTNGVFRLLDVFAVHFTQALTGTGDKYSFGQVSSSEDKKEAVTIEFLDTVSQKRWESILHYMVKINSEQVPAEGTIDLLKKADLLSKDHDQEITQKGFQFMLLNSHAQVWTLLLQYVDLAESLSMDPIEILQFLFQLGSMTLGMAYKPKNLTATQRTMLEDLKDLGLAYQRDANSRFYPTRLATMLTSQNAAINDVSRESFIVLETNFKLYAYTDSPLQIAVLNLFVNLRYRFGNMVVGSIERGSVSKAFVNGITADQILRYLETHAHVQMRTQSPVIPMSVADQIRLWHLERDRLKTTPGCLYDEFETREDYQEVVEYALDLSVLLYENASIGNGVFVVSPAGHILVKEFLQRKKALL